MVWWSLIPGGIMLLTGGALLIGGPALDVLAYFGQGSLFHSAPIVLIAVGLYLLLWRKGLQE